MPYNKKTAYENKLKFLRAQMKCGFPNIEKAAKKSYEQLIAAKKRDEAMARIVAKNNTKQEKKK